MKIKNLIIYFLIASQLVVGCINAENKVGAIIPLSGDFAKYGEKLLSSVKAVSSKEVKYIYEDEACAPGPAVKAYQKLSNIDGIKLFLGPWCGSPQSAVALRLEKGNQLAILGSSSSEKLFAMSGGRMYSTQHSIEQESRFNADKIYELGGRKVVIVFLENEFSRAHEAAFTEKFKGDVLKTLTYSSPDGSALKLLAVKIKNLQPDTLYIPDAYPLMHGLVRELTSIGADKLKLFSVYSAQFQDVLDAVGKAGEGLLYSYPKIGEKNAIEYFPGLAAKIINEIVAKCGSKNMECALSELKNNPDFDQFGILKNEMGLKTIKDGKFVWLE